MTDKIASKKVDASAAQLHQEHTRTLSELERYKLLVESVQDYAIFFMDPHGYIQSWNKGAQNTKGYTSEEIIGRHFSIFYSKKDIDAHKPERELEIAKKVGRVEDEDWRLRKDGTRFWANVVITALYDEEGQLQGFAKVTRNLTERKENEDRLRSANALLRDQQKELERLNESKDDFISLASHQLRTPATAIKQLLGMILEGFVGEVPPHLLRILEKTYQSNERQIAIVNSLLRVAQIDSGKVVLHQKAVDMNNLIDNVVEQYSGVIADRKQTIHVHVSAVPVYAKIDEHYFRMVLENILDNASKYTKNGGTIEVATWQDEKNASISISDTGVGIHADQLDSLFEKFTRIPNELSHKISGSGLGLYWVQKVMELHRGEIVPESIPGEGTCFTLRVPMEDQNA